MAKLALEASACASRAFGRLRYTPGIRT